MAHGVVGLHGGERLVTVQLWHDHVEKHHVDHTGVRGKDRETFGAVLGLEDVEAQCPEPLHEEQTVDRAVVDDERRAAVTHGFVCSASHASNAC